MKKVKNKIGEVAMAKLSPVEEKLFNRILSLKNPELVTNAELALLIGRTKRTVQTTVKSLKKKGFIESVSHGIGYKVLNPGV